MCSVCTYPYISCVNFFSFSPPLPGHMAEFETHMVSLLHEGILVGKTRKTCGPVSAALHQVGWTFSSKDLFYTLYTFKLNPEDGQFHRTDHQDSSRNTWHEK